MFYCTQCGYSQLKWSGQCPSCHVWNTLKEKEEVAPVARGGQKKVAGKQKEVIALNPRSTSHTRLLVKSPELAGVLGGGLVRGSLTLLSGEPGIGKSTLTLELAHWCASNDTPVLYIS